MDFGTSVIGETLKRSITLTNDGAMGTKFEFFKMSSLKVSSATVETSLGGLVGVHTYLRSDWMCRCTFAQCKCTLSSDERVGANFQSHVGC